MSTHTDEHEKLLSRVRAQVERGERVATDDVEALFSVVDTSALARIARIPRERRHGRAAYYTNVDRVCVGSGRVSRSGPDSSIALEPTSSTSFEGLVDAARTLGSSGRTSIVAPEQWLQRASKESNESVQSLLDRLRGIGSVSLSVSLDNDDPLDVESLGATLAAASDRGIVTTAAMTYYTEEAPALYAMHLDAIRSAQDSTGVIRSFVVVAEHRTDRNASYLANPTAHQTLRAVAIARIALDNVEHIGVAPALVTSEVAVVALSYGADLIETTVRSSTGSSAAAGVTELPVVAMNEAGAEVDNTFIASRIVEARFVAYAVDECASKLPASGESTVGAST